MTCNLEKYLAEHFNASKSEISTVVKHFKHLEADKNTLLLENGDVCRYLYFVLKGCVRAYFSDEQGQESTRHIAFENQFITTIHGFVGQIPSNENISTLEDCELLAIPYTDFKSAMSNIPLFKDLYIKLLETAYITQHWRLGIFLKMNAKQRYEYLLKNNKQILQRLSNKIVASYLGITQESLSRLKGQK